MTTPAWRDKERIWVEGCVVADGRILVAVAEGFKAGSGAGPGARGAPVGQERLCSMEERERGRRGWTGARPRVQWAPGRALLAQGGAAVARLGRRAR